MRNDFADKWWPITQMFILLYSCGFSRFNHGTLSRKTKDKYVTAPVILRFSYRKIHFSFSQNPYLNIKGATFSL